MELTIRTLQTIADYIIRLANFIKDAAIDRLLKQEDKAERRREGALQASHEAWDREVKRHKDALQRLNQCACEADAKCAAEVQAIEDKIKRIELS